MPVVDSLIIKAKRGLFRRRYRMHVTTGTTTAASGSVVNLQATVRCEPIPWWKVWVRR